MTAEHIVEYREMTDLHPHPHNPRGPIDPYSPEIMEMAESIKSVGLLSPLLITPKGIVVCGHRRYVACLKAGLDMVPVFVRDIPNADQLVIMLIENMQRKDLSTIQTARGYRALKDSGKSIKEIAVLVGYSAMSVSKHLDVLKLPAEVQAMVENSTFPLGAVQPLLEIGKKSEQIRLAKLSAEGNWLISEIAKAVNKSPHNTYRPREEPSKFVSQPREDDLNSIGLKMIDRLFYLQSDLARYPEFAEIAKLMSAGQVLLADILEKRKKPMRIKSAS